jgi:hypothetical protein
MDHEPSKPRRRWKRRTALTLILVVGCGVWMVGRGSVTVRRARLIRHGMTKEQVQAIMGQPYYASDSAVHRGDLVTTRHVETFATRGELMVRDFKLTFLWLGKQVGLGPSSYGQPFPVIVVFEDGQVSGVSIDGR